VNWILFLMTTGVDTQRRKSEMTYIELTLIEDTLYMQKIMTSTVTTFTEDVTDLD
jgi:hypothetical protein